MTEALLNQLGFEIQSASSAHWILSCIDVSLIGAAVVIVGLVFERLLNRKLSSKFLYCFWMLILIRFVLIWAPESPTSFLNSISQLQETSPSIVVIEPIVPSAFVVAEKPAIATFETTHSQPTLSTPLQFTPQETPRKINWILIATTVWLSGCVILFARLISSWRNLRRTISLATEARNSAPALASICDEQVRVLKLRRRVRLLVTDQLCTPATAGILRPTILIPQRCVDELNVDKLRLVLCHELIHVQRHDGLLQLIAWVIQTIHWFNPLTRIAVAKMAAHRELSCDQAVLRSLNNIAKKLYGETILQLAEFEMSDRQPPTVLAHGFIGPNKNLITQRIDMVIESNKSRWISNCFGAVMVVTMLAIGYTEAQSPTLPEEEEAAENSRSLKPESNDTSDDEMDDVHPLSKQADFSYRVAVLQERLEATFEKNRRLYARNGEWPKPFPRQTMQPIEVQLHSRVKDYPGAKLIAKQMFGGTVYSTTGVEEWPEFKATALAKRTYASPLARSAETLKTPDMIMPLFVPITMTEGRDGESFSIQEQSAVGSGG